MSDTSARRGVHVDRQQAARGPLRRRLARRSRTAMTRSSGCRVWDAEGREYLDLIMALGAVALGYGHPEVNAAAVRAVGNGVVGPLPPVLEAELAADLRRIIPWVEQVRFLKTGRGGDGRGGAAGAHRYGAGGRARLRLPRLAQKFLRSERDGSLRIPSSIFLLTVTGEYADDADEALSTADPDVVLRPDIDTVCVAPGYKTPTAFVFADAYHANQRALRHRAALCAASAWWSSMRRTG